MNKEQRGIYNVTFNDKRATSVKTDLELIEDAIIAQVIMYVKGYHNIRLNSGFGAEHIKLHLEKGSEGYITIEELLNLGNSIREYLKNFGEPFIENNRRKLYEWQDENEVRFRAVVDKVRGEGLDVPLSSSNEIIITYYSDRNAKTPLFFKNPKVQGFYDKHESRTNSAESKPRKIR